MSDRATRIMQNLHQEQRATERKSVCLSARVSCPVPECQDKIGLIRDVSPSGIFFYSNFSPDMGTTVTLSFNVPGNDDDPKKRDNSGEVTCTGTVVRVVKFSEGAATGIAIRLGAPEMQYRQVC